MGGSAVVSQIGRRRLGVVVLGKPIGLRASGAVSSSDGTRPDDGAALRAVVAAAGAEIVSSAIVGVSAGVVAAFGHGWLRQVVSGSAASNAARWSSVRSGRSRATVSQIRARYQNASLTVPCPQTAQSCP